MTCAWCRAALRDGRGQPRFEVFTSVLPGAGPYEIAYRRRDRVPAELVFVCLNGCEVRRG